MKFGNLSNFRSTNISLLISFSLIIISRHHYHFFHFSSLFWLPNSLLFSIHLWMKQWPKSISFIPLDETNHFITQRTFNNILFRCTRTSYFSTPPSPPLLTCSCHFFSVISTIYPLFPSFIYFFWNKSESSWFNNERKSKNHFNHQSSCSYRLCKLLIHLLWR